MKFVAVLFLLVFAPAAVYFLHEAYNNSDEDYYLYGGIFAFIAISMALYLVSG